MQSSRYGPAGITVGLMGLALVLALHWMVFFWVPTEAEQGIIQRIFYIHVPAAWVGFLAFGLVALFGAVYLWLGDERLDIAAVSAAEAGMVFMTAVLITGPIWGGIAWGRYWQWEPRLTLSLLLWFIYLGYFLVRASTANPERGRRLSAIIGIVGVADIPLIHLSVTLFRRPVDLHPPPAVANPEGPTVDPQMLLTFFTGLLGFTLLFVGLLLLRIGFERVRRQEERDAVQAAEAHS